MMKYIRLGFLLILHLASLYVIGFVGPGLGFVLSIAGFVKLRDIPIGSSLVPYVYFPLSGLLFASGLVCLLIEAENRNNQLHLKGSEFGFKILKFWRYQNVLTACICLCVLFLAVAYSAGLIRGTMDALNR